MQTMRFDRGSKHKVDGKRLGSNVEMRTEAVKSLYGRRRQANGLGQWVGLLRY